MRQATRLLVSATMACVMATAGSLAAAGRDLSADPGGGVLIGQGVVCDSAGQVKHFSRLLEDHGVQEAINLVNEEAANPVACAVVLAAFVPGHEVEDVDHHGQALKIVEITVVAVPLEGSWRVVPPVKQYAVFRPKGIEI